MAVADYGDGGLTADVTIAGMMAETKLLNCPHDDMFKQNCQELEIVYVTICPRTSPGMFYNYKNICLPSFK